MKLVTSMKDLSPNMLHLEVMEVGTKETGALDKRRSAILESLERKGRSGNVSGWSQVSEVRTSPSTQRGCFLCIREKDYQLSLLTTLLAF